MADIIQTLQLKEDPTTKVFPRIKSDGIPSGAVTTDKIDASAVTSSKIADSAIQSRHFAPGAVDNSALSNGSVDTDKLNTDAVTSGKILDGAVTRAKVANGAINKAKTNIQIINLWDYCGCDMAIDIQQVFQALEMEFFGLVRNGTIAIMSSYVIDYDLADNFYSALVYFSPSDLSMNIRLLYSNNVEDWQMDSTTSLVTARANLLNLKLVIIS